MRLYAPFPNIRDQRKFPDDGTADEVGDGAALVGGYLIKDVGMALTESHQDTPRQTFAFRSRTHIVLLTPMSTHVNPQKAMLRDDLNGNRLSMLLRTRREAAQIEMVELAKRIKMSRQVLGAYERGKRVYPLDPDYANAIATELKNVSVLEIVMAMGYQVAIAGLAPDELALIDEYRRLGRAERAALRAGARALVGTLTVADEAVDRFPQPRRPTSRVADRD